MWKKVFKQRLFESTHQNFPWQYQKIQVCFLWKIFGLKGHFECHVKVIHGKVKALKCGSCHRSFGQQGNLKKEPISGFIWRHLKKTYECEHCNKELSDSYNLYFMFCLFMQKAKTLNVQNVKKYLLPLAEWKFIRRRFTA